MQAAVTTVIGPAGCGDVVPLPPRRVHVPTRERRIKELATAVAIALVAAVPAGADWPGVNAAGRESDAASTLLGAAASCDSVAAYHLLDFWVGEWDVFVQSRLIGRNRIEKILNGCAIMEHWRDALGNEGKSLFYYQPVAEAWRQVWITDRATLVGGLKEKDLIGVLPHGSLRFQGTVTAPDGPDYLDRTTLSPQPDGGVRQTIAISTDGGATWDVRFDGRYYRREGATLCAPGGDGRRPTAWLASRALGLGGITHLVRRHHAAPARDRCRLGRKGQSPQHNDGAP